MWIRGGYDKQELRHEALLDEYYCALSLYGKFLSRLKGLGVYDNSLIILVGDHGSYQSRFANYNPAIMVKPPGHKGRPRLSHANVSVGDVYPLIVAYLQGGNVGSEFARINRYTDERELTVFVPGADPDNPSQYSQITTEGGLDRIIERLSNQE